MEKQLSEKLPRVEVVDALRGFAVMAILLVHSLEHFIFPVYPVDQPAWLNILNDGVFNVTFTLLAGKSYAIFALLFGFTFYIQSANQQRKGKDFGYRFLWRLLLLVAFATLNAAFFPAGDVKGRLPFVRQHQDAQRQARVQFPEPFHQGDRHQVHRQPS